MLDSTIAVVVPAGGGGTRLWPRSRRATPKQFLDIVSERTMLQETTDRVRALVSPDHLFVITNAQHLGSVREQLPDVPAANIVGEPEGRDSAPAIGLMAALLEQTLGPDTVMVVLPADHVIPQADTFRAILQLAAQTARAGWLVTLGIQPTGPDTGFGYIQAGDEITRDDALGLSVSQVKQFREKPAPEVAEDYVRAGGFYWNAGMFIATVQTVRDLYKQHLPTMEASFAQIVAARNTPQADQVMADIFPTLPKISVDYGIAEKAGKVAVIPAAIGWNDVGSWGRLADVLASDTSEANIVVGQHVGVDTHGSFIYSPDRLVATIGMDDIVVIDTPDAILICPKHRAEDVKRVVDELKARGSHHLL